MFLPMFVLAALSVPVLNSHLDRWEKATAGLTSFRADFQLVRTDAVFNRSQKYLGTVLWVRPNLVRLRLAPAADPTKAEECVYDGRALLAYDEAAKTVTEFRVQDGYNPLAGVLFGLAGADRTRFAVTLLGEDEHYVRFEVRPVRAADEREFRVLRIALYGPRAERAYLPARVMWLKPDGAQEDWMFTNVEMNPPGVDAKAFEPADRPGFRRVKFPWPVSR